MELLSGLIMPVLMVAAIYIAVTIVTIAQKGLPWSKKRRSPFTSMFLRSPGWSTYQRVEELRVDIFAYLVGIVCIPAFIVSTPFMQSAISGKQISVLTLPLIGLISVGAFLFLVAKIYRSSKMLHQYRLGYEGEVAVGQELNQLMLEGFHVFHDFPADKFNIDHVVVGNTGVFAVETKARRKPDSGNRKQDVQLELTGNILKFPHMSEAKSVEQAKDQARWLGQWLSSAVGEPVNVVPALAVPGWYITITGRPDVLIYNGKRPDTVFPKYSGKGLSENMIKRIRHQLDTICRDVEPRG